MTVALKEMQNAGLKPPSDGLRLAYLGPPIDHRDVLGKAMAGQGYPLTLIPDSMTWGNDVSAQARPGGALGRLQRIRQQFAGTRDRGYLDHALQLIDSNAINTVIAYWGTLPLPDMIGLKRARPSLRFVLHLLCHPLGLTRGRIALQDLIFRNAIDSVDAMLYSSTAMQRYVEHKVLGGRRIPGLLYKPCWTSDYLADDPPMEPRERPNVVFLGRMDWKHAQPSDNVRQLLTELMDQGIDVHFSRSRDGSIAHPNAIPFEPLPLMQVPTFASQFDASLVAYNMAAAPCPYRFENTVPDRLITSVCAGIPIAVPAKGFSGSKEYLEELGAVIVYESAADLAEKLRDRETMRQLRAMARRNNSLYTAERRIPELLRFLGDGKARV
jgi:hypothetical protein